MRCVTASERLLRYVNMARRACVVPQVVGSKVRHEQAETLDDCVRPGLTVRPSDQFAARRRTRESGCDIWHVPVPVLRISKDSETHRGVLPAPASFGSVCPLRILITGRGAAVGVQRR